MASRAAPPVARAMALTAVLVVGLPLGCLHPTSPGRLSSREPAAGLGTWPANGADEPAADVPAGAGQAGNPVPPSSEGQVHTPFPPSAPDDPGTRAFLDPDSSCTLPAYPEQARRRGWSGRVLVRVHVAADGAVISTEVAGTSGYDLLDQSAVEAVRRWRFRPAVRDGVGVADVVDVPVRFELQGG